MNIQKKRSLRVLIAKEEEKLVKYILAMYNKDLDLTSITLKIKFFEISKIKWTIFKNKIYKDK